VRWINPAGGDWGVPANWSAGRLPGPGDVAIIDIPGVTVTHSAGADAVDDLVASNGTFVFGGGTVDVARTVQGSSDFRLEGGGLARATVAAGTTVNGTLRRSALDAVTFAPGATLELNDPFAPAHVDVYNGLTMNGTANVGDTQGRWQGELYFWGTQSLLGNGRFNARPTGAFLYQPQEGGTFTVGPDLRLEGNVTLRARAGTSSTSNPYRRGVIR
jgi:hypothetical protein